MNRSTDRIAPLAGVAFVLLLFLNFSVGGDPPGADGATDEVAGFWTDNADSNIVGGLLGALAGAAAIFFGGHVRGTLRDAEGEAGRLSAIAFAGFVAIALGVAIWSAFQYAAADTAGDVPAETTQTLAVLVEWSFIPFAMGMAVAFLAAGAAILRHGGLPRWLGYVALPTAIFFFTPVYFVGLIGAAIWILSVSYLLARGTQASLSV